MEPDGGGSSLNRRAATDNRPSSSATDGHSSQHHWDEQLCGTVLGNGAYWAPQAASSSPRELVGGPPTPALLTFPNSAALRAEIEMHHHELRNFQGDAARLKELKASVKKAKTSLELISVGTIIESCEGPEEGCPHNSPCPTQARRKHAL